MNKYIILILIGLSIATQVQAECNGGRWITSRKATDSGCSASTCNEKTFCVSTNGMNWWSAMAWCKANGMQLASIEDLCPGVQLNTEACPNWNGLAYNSWTRSIDGSGSAWQAGKANTGKGTWSRGKTDTGQWGPAQAACVEISASN